MGLIRAVKDAIGGALADQWLESIESDVMSPTTITAPGVKVRPGDKRDGNVKGTATTVSNGSMIQVKEGQFMLLTDGGKIIDYTAEAGYFKVDNSSLPSLFNGNFGDALKESFNRVRFGGATPQQQRVYYLNMQEIRDLKFGTPNKVNYFDTFYNAELFLRAHGTYTIRITDPIKFYIQVADHDATRSIEARDMNEQYNEEFLTAFQSALNQMSADGQSVRFVTSKSQELANYMQDVLDEKWNELRGFKIESVAVTISYDEESQKLINMRNQGAMLSDASIREGYVQGSIARGIEAAGSNENGAMGGFMGMGIGMGTIGGGMGQFSQTNAQQMQQQAQQAQQAQPSQQPGAGAAGTGGAGAGASGVAAGAAGVAAGSVANGASEKASWTCPKCGTQNTGKFCTECGAKKPEDGPKHCPNCGEEVSPNAKFCPNCGYNLQEK